MNATCRIQEQLIPGYISEAVAPELSKLQDEGYGCKLMGAGGAGYILIVAKTQPDDAEKITIRRQSLSL